jgi:hypothetical protein
MTRLLRAKQRGAVLHSRGSDYATLLEFAQRRSPDSIAAARMSCSGEAFSIPGIELSTRRWQRSRD